MHNTKTRYNYDSTLIWICKKISQALYKSKWLTLLKNKPFLLNTHNQTKYLIKLYY